MITRKTNKGQEIDLEGLMAASGQGSRALGNMGVNAKGDVLGKGGEVVQKNEDRVRAYYRDNPKSSTATASLKGPMPKLKPDTADTSVIAPETAKTAQMEAEKVAKPKKQKKKEPEPPPVDEPEEFDAPIEPLGYNEVELPNGDIEMVPYYKEDDKK